MVRSIVALAGLAGMLAGQVSAASPPADRPVRVGGERELDACRTLAKPTGLKPGGDGYLSLRAGPGTGFRELLRLKPDRQVLICGEEGAWAAVVVADPAGKDCGVSRPIQRATVYRGPCRSGWAATRFLQVLAG